MLTDRGRSLLAPRRGRLRLRLGVRRTGALPARGRARPRGRRWRRSGCGCCGGRCGCAARSGAGSTSPATTCTSGSSWTCRAGCRRSRSSRASRSRGSASRRPSLRRSPGGLAGGYIVPAVPRGRYAIASSSVVLEDPFGLERIEVAALAPGRAARLSAPRRARDDLLGRRRPHARGKAADHAPADGLRAALGARARAGRVAAPRPLAVHGSPRRADGEGARGRAKG